MKAAPSRTSSKSLGVLGCIEKRPSALKFSSEMGTLYGAGHHEVDRSAKEPAELGLESKVVAQPGPEFLLGQELHKKIQITATRIEGVRGGRAKQLQPPH